LNGAANDQQRRFYCSYANFETSLAGKTVRLHGCNDN